MIQRLLSGKAENTVRVSLQTCQVIQKRRLFQLFFRLNSFDHDFTCSLALLKDYLGVVFCRKRRLDTVRSPAFNRTVQKGSGLKAAI